MSGTLTMLFAASNLMKIPAYGALGQLTFENLAVGAALLPAAVIANYAGIWLVRRTPTELFFRIVYVLMFLIAVELIRGSLVELWRADATAMQKRVARRMLLGSYPPGRAPLPPA